MDCQRYRHFDYFFTEAIKVGYLGLTFFLKGDDEIGEEDWCVAVIGKAHIVSFETSVEN